MIFNAIVSALCGLLGAVLDALPDLTLPAFITDLAATIGDALSNVQVFGWFLPLNAMGNAVTFLLAVTAVILVVRVLRLVVSLATGGGGNLT